MSKKLSATTTGLLGEYITAASIISLGWRVSLCQQDSLDLLAFDEDGSNFYRIQVKSASLTLHFQQPSTPRPAGYKFQNGSGRVKKILTPDKYDILAHCAVDKRRCVFYALHTVNNTSKRYRPEFFDNPSIEEDSWNKAIEDVKNYRKSRS